MTGYIFRNLAYYDTSIDTQYKELITINVDILYLEKRIDRISIRRSEIVWYDVESNDRNDEAIIQLTSEIVGRIKDLVPNLTQLKAININIFYNEYNL